MEVFSLAISVYIVWRSLYLTVLLYTISSSIWVNKLQFQCTRTMKNNKVWTRRLNNNKESDSIHVSCNFSQFLMESRPTIWKSLIEEFYSFQKEFEIRWMLREGHQSLEPRENILASTWLYFLSLGSQWVQVSKWTQASVSPPVTWGNWE